MALDPGPGAWKRTALTRDRTRDGVEGALRPNANIFQVIVSSDPDPLGGASPSFAANAESLKACHPDHDYHLLNGSDIESVLAADFSTDVQRSYAALRPYAYKADLARYCLLLRFGGLYADLSMRLLHPVELPPGKAMACFRDALFAGQGLWWVHNGLIRAPAGREELRVAVELIVANCRSHYYGATALHPTGPALFGRALASVDREEDIEVGEFRNFSGSMNPHSFGYLDGQGRLIAMRMKTRFLSDLGVKGTNQYPEMWYRRSIYRDVVLRYPASGDALKPSPGCRAGDAIVFDETQDGQLVAGPGVVLEAGRYRARFEGEVVAGAERMAIEACVPDGEVLASAAPGSGALSIDFTLPDAAAVDIRLRSGGGASGRIAGLVIRDLDWPADAAPAA